MDLNSITPVIITWNEEPNIERCLERLQWAQEILVVDSGSTDRTLELCRSNSKVNVLTREFDDFANQVNFGIERVTTPWVLTLDADFILSEQFPDELQSIPKDCPEAGFKSRFVYCIEGAPLRGTLYPPRTVLFRKGSPTYVQDGHGHRLINDEPSRLLETRIEHDDRKPLDRWFSSQANYAKQEASKLSQPSSEKLPIQDRLRQQIWPMVPVIFIYTLIGKGVILDGWKGWFYALQRTYAELLLSLELLKIKLGVD
tara:strand:+ start:2342 stop:3112 length:771 start_codon:yes stop_codon:yes gene_type:complete